MTGYEKQTYKRFNSEHGKNPNALQILSPPLESSPSSVQVGSAR